MKKNGIIITGIVCLTLLILAGIGSFVYVSMHNAEQTKKNAEFEQKQINLRKAVDEACGESAQGNSDFYIPDYNGYTNCDKAKKALEEAAP